MNFTELKVHENIVKALSELGIQEATDIQQKAIPLIKEGKDVIGISNTGSGKTAAFGVPLLETILPGQGIQLLVLAPTRELAVQIAKELQKFGKYLHLHIATIYGGVGFVGQEEQLAKADIVVGTPGRLLDHLRQRKADFSPLHRVVLDEADKMVDMGFIEDITSILEYIHDIQQMLLFGATLSREIDVLKEKYMRAPAQVEGEMQVKSELLQQFYYDVPRQQKFSLLMHLLRKEEKEADKVIIFCSSRSTVEMLWRNLHLQNMNADMLHGKMSQSRRLQMIDKFNKGAFPILVASAVAARGLHIESVSHVFNYDLSQDPEEYIHRVGRTARAGKNGKAITLLEQRDYDIFRQIQSRFPVQIEQLSEESFARVPFDTGRRFGDGRFSGGDRGRYGSGRYGRGAERRGEERGRFGRNQESFGRRSGFRHEERGGSRDSRQERSSYIPNGARLSNPARAPAWAR